MPSTDKTLLCRYHYDPLDRLADCTPLAQASTQRFYLKERLTSEIKGSVQRSIFQQEDQLLAQQQRQDGSVETTLLATDQQRSVLHALDVTQPHPLAYTPYGHRPAENGLLSLLGFNGERPDPVTGHYLLGNGYRAFNPVLMRFNSPDNLSPFGVGGLSAYAYCIGDPVNLSDPSGHFIKTITGLFSKSLNGLYKAASWAIDVTPTPTIAHIPKRGPMQNIKALDNDLFTYSDRYKNKNRLNIGTHGTIPTPQSSSVVFYKNRPTSPDQLLSTLKKHGINPNNFDELRMISCYSGDGANSFIKQLSYLTAKPVKGYSGRVNSSHLPEEIWSEFLEARKQNPKSPQAELNVRLSGAFHTVRKHNPHNLIAHPFAYLSHNFKSIRVTP
ncbi:RHS repeat-associated core domain-containing protein [Pseudomonas sp. Z1-12]|uniref:RHS repeat-associated core domain-containing protein n=1 Tax=Pseudomonas sp. Z1-12 TaxID=2817408 RepID=UPI003DA8F61A